MIMLTVFTYNYERQYNLSYPEDFGSLLDEFPQLAEHLFMATSVEEAARTAANYLNSGHAVAYVSGDGLHKSIARSALAVGLGVGALTPNHTAVDPKPVAQVRQVVAPFGSHPEDAFLWSIRQVESGGSSQVDHPRMSSGIHAGDSAIGGWGLMPNTLQDVARRMRSIGKATPDIDAVSQMPHADMMGYMRDRPDVELSMARFLARHLLQRHKGDEGRAAYAWLHGHNLQPEDIVDEHLDHDYVRRFKQADVRNPFRGHVRKDEAEVSIGFPDQLRTWLKKRTNDSNRPMVDRTYSEDPGRVRDDRLYEGASGADRVRSYVSDRRSKE